MQLKYQSVSAYNFIKIHILARCVNINTMYIVQIHIQNISASLETQEAMCMQWIAAAEVTT